MNSYEQVILNRKANFLNTQGKSSHSPLAKQQAILAGNPDILSAEELKLHTSTVRKRQMLYWISLVGTPVAVYALKFRISLVAGSLLVGHMIGNRLYRSARASASGLGYEEAIAAYNSHKALVGQFNGHKVITAVKDKADSKKYTTTKDRYYAGVRARDEL